MNEELKAFVIKESAVSDEDITFETMLSDDLGIYGDDAIEFIVAYGKAFNVDVSKFMAKNYFDGEGDVILPALVRLFRGTPEVNKKRLTVGHLEKGINAGRLDEDVINNHTR